MIKTCKNCNKQFEVDKREDNRGNGIFCSMSCSTSYYNKHRADIKHTCINCNSEFTSKAYHGRYCSSKCKLEYRKAITPQADTATRSTLSTRINKALVSGTSTCFECSWDKTVCDIHHIIPKHKGGTDSFDNLTVLCPNCHRMAHKGLITSFTSISTRIGLYHQSIAPLDAVGSP